MAFIAWPNYQRTPTSPITRVELMSTAIQLQRPGQRSVQAQFSNKELTFTHSEGEFAGSITIAGHRKNSDAHHQTRTFIEMMMDDPGNNYTLIPWQKPSIGTLGSTFITQTFSDQYATTNNNSIGIVQSRAGGVWRISMLAPGTLDTLVVSRGEYFGFDQKTFMIASVASIVGTRNEFDITVVPEVTDLPTSGTIYKRNTIPMRFIAGQTLQDFIAGSQQVATNVAVVEHRTN